MTISQLFLFSFFFRGQNAPPPSPTRVSNPESIDPEHPPNIQHKVMPLAAGGYWCDEGDVMHAHTTLPKQPLLWNDLCTCYVLSIYKRHIQYYHICCHCLPAQSRPLMQLCRLKIRQQVGIHRLRCINKLPLPPRVIKYLNHEERNQEEFCAY